MTEPTSPVDRDIAASCSAAAMEIAARFNPRKMPWIMMVIEKHLSPVTIQLKLDAMKLGARIEAEGLEDDIDNAREECAKHVEDNFNAPDIAASIREHVGK